MNFTVNFFLFPFENSIICFFNLIKVEFLPLFLFLPNLIEVIELFFSNKVIHPREQLKLKIFTKKKYNKSSFFQSQFVYIFILFLEKNRSFYKVIKLWTKITLILKLESF